MSRLATVSPAAIRAMFSPDSDLDLITLLTITGVGVAAPIRLADNYLLKFEYLSNGWMAVSDLESEDDWVYEYRPDDVVLKEAVNSDRHNALYGVRSRGDYFLFIPFEATLPGEDQSAAPRAQLVINDVTRQVLPIVRSLSNAPSIDIELVLTATPDVVEVLFPEFLMSAVSYDADTVTAEISVESDAVEPFPAYGFTPNYFPGLF